MEFVTHTGEIVTGDKLQAACDAVASWYDNQAVKVRDENAFASHVTQAAKDDYINRFYTQTAQAIRNRENLHHFYAWQRINTELTGECVGFLPKAA